MKKKEKKKRHKKERGIAGKRTEKKTKTKEE